ncbi:g341 [Yersinia phage phiR1-37]|uniref:hypothetical protein n=1 Tax=Yersinia phage phiR1-37 TaxID=331278 RepID=UPI00022DBE00|nr:hypothetical protein phiR1-37_gp341 [Yersinia phage phiR1-37]CCE26364.1 g341 [Yersinia phage phiR1-37]
MKIVKELIHNVSQKITLFTNISENDILYHRKQRLYRETIFRQTRYDVLDTLPDYYVEFKELGTRIETIPICIGYTNEINYLRAYIYS